MLNENFRKCYETAWFLLFKKDSMQELPRIKKFPIAIQFLGTYVIVMGVSNLPGNIDLFIMDI